MTTSTFMGEGCITHPTTSLKESVAGLEVVHLRRKSRQEDQPEFTHAALLPSQGLNTFQLEAFVPGRGLVPIFHSIPITEAASLFQAADPYGNLSFKYGGAILVPFANRIRGRLNPVRNEIQTQIAGREVHLAANWKGQKPGAEPHAMHGLILNQTVKMQSPIDNDSESSVSGELQAGDFSGHWPGKMNVRFHVAIQKKIFRLDVETKNTGEGPVPVGIGWHPYFNLPSRKRAQVRLMIPAEQRALVDNYDNVFPTGEIQAVRGTPYDFGSSGGRELGDLFLDDCFLGLKGQGQGPLIAEIIDPEAHYGLRIRALSPQIKAFQVYAPVTENFIAVEPQFNLGDPGSPLWKEALVDPGMVMLQPGESVTYSVELELFTPR